MYWWEGGGTGAQNIVKEIINSTRKSGHNKYKGWIQIEYQNMHYNINQKDEHRSTREEMEGPISS